MSKFRSLNRRKFLAQSATLAAAALLPTAAFAQESMRTRVIPGTDEQLPVVGMGAPDIFVDYQEVGKELPISIIQTMMDMGGKLMDTPAFFRPNVPAVGGLLTEMGVQKDLFLIGKSTVNGKETATVHLEKLVANLNKQPIDLLLLHNMRELDIQWPILKEWKNTGRVRYIGVSLTRKTDYDPLEKFMKDENPDFIMPGYSITQQGPAERILPLAADSGIAVIAVEPFKALGDGAFFSVVAEKELPEWTADFDCESWAQFSLKYILSNPAITSVVTETSKVSHVIDNMRAGYGGLPDEATRKRMSAHLLSL